MVGRAVARTNLAPVDSGRRPGKARAQPSALRVLTLVAPLALGPTPGVGPEAELGSRAPQLAARLAVLLALRATASRAAPTLLATREALAEVPVAAGVRRWDRGWDFAARRWGNHHPRRPGGERGEITAALTRTSWAGRERSDGNTRAPLSDGTAAHANRLHQPRRRATASARAAAGRLKLPERQHGQSLLSAGAASTPLPPEAGSGRHATPGGATMALSALWEARARAPASAKVSDSTAFHHPGKATLRHCHDGLRRSWSSHLTGRLRHRP